MKRIEEQTCYEILEVSPTATADEIQKAYERAKETFRSDSLAIYSLYSEKEIEEIQAAIEKAYRVLMEEALSKSFDRPYPKTPEGRAEEGPSERGGLSWDGAASPSFSDVPVDPEEEPYRGKSLKRIRQRMGIDLRTISAQTKINMKMLEWIEEEAVERLPALVYLKGFLKGYAQCLGLDPQKVIQGYVKFLEESQKK
ncbi:MAG: helix-turn-helix domain-containing protein [Syntrophaceae bacterium]|nr:helix-turn-helix domain-containing protein [Syntrophaceae bacterium]